MTSEDRWTQRCHTSAAVAAATALLMGVVTAPEASAKEGVKIGYARIEGKTLKLYHESVKREKGDVVRIDVRGNPCSPLPGKTFQAQSAGDSLTTLFVIDRGGKRAMALHSDAILGAIKRFMTDALEEDDHARFAIVDALGYGNERAYKPPSGDAEDLKTWIDARPKARASGANIYNQTIWGLNELDSISSPTPLRAAIIISDGVDPDAKRGTSGAPQKLIANANRKGIPVSTILIDRGR
ncbi:MAG: vWA domain-containing protein, partial [Myxococcota bacterium]|nr:vWA domain-containing protein [Myxococcota bacterium]